MRDEMVILRRTRPRPMVLRDLSLREWWVGRKVARAAPQTTAASRNLGGSLVLSKICEGAGTLHSSSDNGYAFLMHAISTLPRVARLSCPIYIHATT